MSLPAAVTEEIRAIKPYRKFEGHTDSVYGVIRLPGEQRIMTCTPDGSLRVWNLQTGKQIGNDWRDGDSDVFTIALSLDGKKVVSGSNDAAVRLWDVDTGKVIAKWTGHNSGWLKMRSYPHFEPDWWAYSCFQGTTHASLFSVFSCINMTLWPELVDHFSSLYQLNAPSQGKSLLDVCDAFIMLFIQSKCVLGGCYTTEYAIQGR
jgi:WD40 repeat protein